MKICTRPILILFVGWVSFGIVGLVMGSNGPSSVTSDCQIDHFFQNNTQFPSGDDDKLQATQPLIRDSVLAGPKAGINYLLMFSSWKMSPKYGRVIDFFFSKILAVKDTVTVFTPMRSYFLRQGELWVKGKDAVIKELKALVSRDIAIAGSDHRMLIRKLKRMVSAVSKGNGSSNDLNETVELLFSRYRELLPGLERLRCQQQRRLLHRLQYHGKKRGNNLVWIFYAREHLPSPSVEDIHLMKMVQRMKGRQDIVDILGTLFDHYKREPILDKQELNRILAALNLKVNVIMFKDSDSFASESSFSEHSEDTKWLFEGLTRRTGGQLIISSNLYAGFKQCLADGNR